MTRREPPKGPSTRSLGSDSTKGTAGRSRASDPETSTAAARDCKARAQADQIAAVLKSARRPLTADDIGERLGIHRYIVASRLARMRRRGLVDVAGRGPARGFTRRTVQTWRRA